MLDLLLINGDLVFPDEGVTKGSIGVKDGRIAAILAPGTTLPAKETIDCAGKWVMPGVIDPHVHYGFGSPDTDFATETRNAAIGGVTSVLSFYRTADFRTAFDEMRDKAVAQACIDFGFHFGITSDLHVETLDEASRRFGVSSYKLYLMYKGQAGLAMGFTDIDDGLLYTSLRETAKIPGGVLGVHCENVEVIPAFRDPLRRAGADSLQAWDQQSPAFLEAENVHRVCYFAAKTACPVNIVHLSSREALDEVRRHRQTRGAAPIYVETCPHYLFITNDTPAGPLAKVNPPVRGADDVDAMWEGVRDGSVTTVGTDHVPRKRSTKQKDIWSASAGFPGTATMLPILIHEGYHKRGIAIERIAAVASANSAKMYNMPSKGTLTVGKDADLIVVDPNLERTVDAATLESFSDYSPFEGMTLKGWPTLTLLRGMKVAENGVITAEARATPQGRYLSRL